MTRDPDYDTPVLIAYPNDTEHVGFWQGSGYADVKGGEIITADAQYAHPLVKVPRGMHPLDAERILAEHAEDAALVEAMAKAGWGEDWESLTDGPKAIYRAEVRRALAALRAFDEATR